MAEQQAILTEGTAPTYGGASVLITETPTPTRVIDLSDKLTLINQALANTGNNLVTTPDDNSDEWRVGSSSFDQWVQTLLYNGEWKFATKIATTTSRIGNSPFPGFSDVYDMPMDCLYLHNACRAEEAASVIPALGYGKPDQDTRFPDFEYRIVNDQIHAVAQQGLLLLYTPFPQGAQPWSVGFIDALRLYVEAGCLRGLNEDFAEANQREARATKAAEMALSRDQARESTRVLFRSSVLERRQSRGWGWGQLTR